MSLPILGTCLIASSSDSLLEFINLLMAHQMYSPYGTFLFTTLFIINAFLISKENMYYVQMVDSHIIE